MRHPVLAHQFEGQLAFGRQRLDGTVYLADGLGGNAVVLGSRAGAGEKVQRHFVQIDGGQVAFPKIIQCLEFGDPVDISIEIPDFGKFKTVLPNREEHIGSQFHNSPVIADIQSDITGYTLVIKHIKFLQSLLGSIAGQVVEDVTDVGRVHAFY